MARRADEGKLLEWQERLAKFDSSGLSVAAYCRQKKITPARFYYWEKRVREAGRVGRRVWKEPDEKSTSNTEVSWAEVVVGDSVRVRLPHDPQLIGAVVQELQTAAQAKPSFERIDLVAGQ